MGEDEKIIVVYDGRWNVYEERSCPDLARIPAHCYHAYPMHRTGDFKGPEMTYFSILEKTLRLNASREVPTEENSKSFLPHFSIVNES